MSDDKQLDLFAPMHTPTRGLGKMPQQKFAKWTAPQTYTCEGCGEEMNFEAWQKHRCPADQEREGNSGD